MASTLRYSDRGRGAIERRLHEAYKRWVRPHVASPVHRQRLRLAWFAWEYAPLLALRSLPLRDRLAMVGRFLRVDWSVRHGHRPGEAASVVRALAERRARPGEVMVEAGCWQGGSTAKFSIACSMLGYRLRVFDSFAGVPPLSEDEKAESFDFSGMYAAPERLVREHVERYGEPSVCSFHPGLFADTLAARPVDDPVRVVYIDCDLARATEEALAGTVRSVVDDGWVFSQDFHIKPVRDLLCRAGTWDRLGRGAPSIARGRGNLAALRFTPAGSTRDGSACELEERERLEVGGISQLTK